MLYTTSGYTTINDPWLKYKTTVPNLDDQYLERLLPDKYVSILVERHYIHLKTSASWVKNQFAIA